MKPRKDDADFNPLDGMPDDPFAMGSREVRYRWGSDEDGVETADQDKRLPRPSTARTKSQPMTPRGEGQGEH